MTTFTSVLLLMGACLGAIDANNEARSPGFAFFEPVRPPRPIQVVAQEGAIRYLPANRAHPLALSIGDAVEWIELEVNLGPDGHHSVLDGRASATRTNAGAAPPGQPLAPLLEQARGRINLCLDCEQINALELAREISAAGMERQVVICAADDVLRSVRAAAPSELALMARWQPGPNATDRLDDVRPAAVRIDVADVTAQACREFGRRGLKVLVKTAGGNDRPEVWNQMAAAGVHWLQTDVPEEVLAWQALKSMPKKPVKIACHRGAGRYAPENTLPAFEKAIRLGADFVEFDLQTTRDGQVVLLHDATLDRTTTGKGRVREWDLAAISALDAGSWFSPAFARTRPLTLDGFLSAIGRRVQLYVDAKDIAPETLAAALKRHGLTDRAVVYQGVGYLERLRSIDPAIRRMPSLRDPSRLDFVIDRVQPFAVDARWSILTRDLIDRCHARGVEVFSDALGVHETIEEYQRAIENGIDVIQTDHPARVLRAMEQYHESK
jgi:glycerophosphoryl diester phosphodiesterase